MQKKINITSYQIEYLGQVLNVSSKEYKNIFKDINIKDVISFTTHYILSISEYKKQYGK